MAIRLPLVLGSDGVPQQLQSGDAIDRVAALPAYVSGRWYLPPTVLPTLGGLAPGSGTIKFMPLVISRAVTVSQLGVLITTVFSGGKVRLGIYASGADGKPTGSPLGVVSDLSTTTAAPVSGAMASNVTLSSGLYWLAVQTDNATAAFLNPDRTAGESARIVGDTTLTNVLQVSTTGFSGYQLTGTYAGGMPDVTAGGYSVNSGQSGALIAFKVA